MGKKNNKGQNSKKIDQKAQNFNEGQSLLSQYPLLSPLAWRVRIIRTQQHGGDPAGWAWVYPDGTIYANADKLGTPAEWAYALGACILHLGFKHFERGHKDRELWNAACAAAVARFLSDLKVGVAPRDKAYPLEIRGRNEQEFFEWFAKQGIPESMESLGVGGVGGTMRENSSATYKVERWRYGGVTKWDELLAEGIREAVRDAVDVAGGVYTSKGQAKDTAAERARLWFMTGYPLFGGLAAGFTIVEDLQACQRADVSVAAVDTLGKVIFINPAAALDELECRFVIAHEILHVALRHHARREGRDPFLWNSACDYVINLWLAEMGIGRLPSLGLLYDPSLKGESAEAIYARLVKDERRSRKLRSFKGVGEGDIIEPDEPEWWKRGDGVRLDEYCRRALVQGLDNHLAGGRGLLPAGLMEEIKALETPPPKWDVKLAQWFEHHFPAGESTRTYSRMGRRQASTPHIPRPARVPVSTEGRTFGVVLDTSGSMDSRLLGQALGAIASYSASHDVPYVRLVYCDSRAYDAGYVPPDTIADGLTVKGRGGTVLQPGIDLLEQARNFPQDGPILIITDGACDVFQCRREHGILMPRGAILPMRPQGQVFELDE